MSRKAVNNLKAVQQTSVVLWHIADTAGMWFSASAALHPPGYTWAAPASGRGRSWLA